MSDTERATGTLPTISPFPGSRLIGLELSWGMLSRARSKTSDVDWVLGDGWRLPFADETYDYICNQFSYPHASGRTTLFQEIFRALKPSGRFVLANISPG